MSSTALQPALETTLAANLAALARSNADVAEKIRTATAAADVALTETSQDAPAGALLGRSLCSRHQPLTEAQRLAERVDLVEHAVVVVLGFAMGYHVQALAQRMGKSGVLVVFEPDMALARAVLERVDHSKWLRETNVVWMTDATDRGVLAAKLRGAETILAQGIEILAHPASRDRLGDLAGEFSRLLSSFMESARTTLLTNLMRTVDTVSNLTGNLDHYLLGQGIAPLHQAAAGCTAVVVSAGPSLKRNMHLLAQPGVRDRCVIIAVQTALRPLLDAGIRPHFVTALDFHEISRRFYEGLTAEAVHDVTLVAEPKVHPAVIDAFPGMVRCSGSIFLDQLLGDLKRDMGTLPAGATVAHLAVYLAHYLGCTTIAMIGQDLGFTDGLYYGSGTAIDDVWAPELNPFNTMEMMQWQRIVRHRAHLYKTTDVRGRSMYSDAQMAAYLQQFERDFAGYEREGIRIIDASEGGVAKQHTVAMPLEQVLSVYATRPLPELPKAEITSDEISSQRASAAHRRLAHLRRDIADLRETSRRTQRLIEKMLADQQDQAKMRRHFAQLEQFQKRVQQRDEAFRLLEFLNQLGAFKRHKADRRLHMQSDLAPLERQRLQLERDKENVAWIIEAADHMLQQLAQGQRLLDAEPQASSRSTSPVRAGRAAAESTRTRCRIVAMIPVDGQRNGLGVPRSLAEQYNDRSVLQATLERLCASTTLERIILIVSDEVDIEPLLDRRSLKLPIEIERCEGSPFGIEHQAIAAARLVGQTCWRGGLGGMSIYDEVLCPQLMHQIMERRGIDAALLAGPDWPLINVTGEDGCDAVIRRYLQEPQRHTIVFTQAPPGLCGCLVSATLMRQLAKRNRLGVIGGLLTYQPHMPHADPIGTDANVQIDHRVRRSLIRVTYDTPRWRASLDSCRHHISEDSSTVEIVQAMERCVESRWPEHIVLELTPRRTSRGLFRQRLLAAGGLDAEPDRPDMSAELFQRIIEQLGEAEDCLLTFGGLGDPLLHEQCVEFIAMAKAGGIRAVHVRSELGHDQVMLDRLLVSGVDAVSVDLHADRAATYQAMMGDSGDRFRTVLMNIEHLVEHRRRLTEHSASAALALPWIVPRLQRCEQTYDDIEPFYDRWQHMLGTAVIEGGPGGVIPVDTLDPAVMPSHVQQRELARRMYITSDGRVPVSELDFAGRDSVGCAGDQSLASLWEALRLRRQRDASAARVCFP